MENKKENQQTKIIVRQDSNKSEGPHLSWGEYRHQVNSYKWWIIAVTLLGGIAGFAGTKFILNPKRETVTSTLSFSLPLNETKDSFLDGTPFDGRNLISKENIKAVIENNEDFKGLNADKVFSALSRSPVENKDANGTVSYSKTDFVLVSCSTTFSSVKQAQAFVGALIDHEVNDVFVPKLENLSLANPFIQNETTDLTNIERNSFVESLSSLKTLDSLLTENYWTLLNTFPGSSVIEGTDTLFSLSNSYTLISKQIERRSGSLYTNFYVNFTDGQEEEKRSGLKTRGKYYKEQLTKFESSIKSKQEVLSSLVQIKNPDFGISQQIVSLSNEISTLNNKKDSLVKSLKSFGYTVTVSSESVLVSEDLDSSTGYYPALKFYKENKDSSDTAKKEEALTWKKESEDYLTSLKDRYKERSKQYKSANKATQVLYKNSNNKIYVKEANYGTVSGHISPYLVAGVGLVLGFFISSLLLAEIGKNIEYKKKKAEAVSAAADAKTDAPKPEIKEDVQSSPSVKAEEKKEEDHTNLDCDKYTKDR